MPTIAHVTTDRTPATAGRLTFATVHAVTAPEPSIIRVPDEAARLFQRLKLTPADVQQLDRHALAEALAPLSIGDRINTKLALSNAGVTVIGRPIDQR